MLAMKTSLGLWLVVAASAACAKQAGGTIAGADAQFAGDALAAEIEDGATGFGPVASQGAANPSCVTLSGNTADTDGDSIPDAATLTFNCSTTEAGHTGTITGTEMVTDPKPTMPSWDFTATADLHFALTAPSGGSITHDRTGTIVGAQQGTTFSLARTLDATTTIQASPTSTGVSIDETNAWTITYAPTVTWMPGAVVVGGTASATGSWSVTMGSNAADATLATTSPLTFTPSCATRVTGGTLTATYEGGGHMNTLTVAWTGCGARTVTYAAR